MAKGQKMSIDKFAAKTKDVGGIPVARLLPQAGKRTIGAWCFLDHAGPALFEEGQNGLQVGAHPHTNLQTFTWMLAGEVWHQDSLGHRQLIRPKQVNLMTAGTGNHRGISHTEQTPDGVHHLHAVQLWIALPMDQEIEPNFQHYPELPEWQEEGVNYILTTGKYHGYHAPTQQYSPLVGVDIQFQQAATIVIEQQPDFEYGVLVIKGQVEIAGVRYQQDELISLQDCTNHNFTLHGDQGTHIMLLGGTPLAHDTLIWWNFVADNQAALQQAVEDWNNGHARFGTIDLQGTTLKRLVAPTLLSNVK